MKSAPFAQCIECSEVITTPLCSICLAGRMQEFVTLHDSRLAEQIHGFKVEGDTICLFCSEPMGLCPHCFSKDICEFIAINDTKLAYDFMGRFDFDLRRKLSK